VEKNQTEIFYKQVINTMYTYNNTPYTNLYITTKDLVNYKNNSARSKWNELPQKASRK